MKSKSILLSILAVLFGSFPAFIGTDLEVATSSIDKTASKQHANLNET